jgi:O-antigen ligase
MILHTLNLLLRFSGIVLLFLCIFDPQDLLFGKKMHAFMAFVFLSIVMLIVRKEKIELSYPLLLFLLAFILLPVLSSIVFFFMNGASFNDYDGLGYMKAYLFLTFSIFLVLTRVRLINSLVRILVLLSFSSIIIALVVHLFPELFLPVYLFGGAYGIFAMPVRNYFGYEFRAVYFHAAPVLILAFGYYLSEIYTSRRNHSLVYAIIVLLALILSGTRNTVFIGFVMIIMFYFVYSQSKQIKFVSGFILIISLLFIPLFINELLPANLESDQIKSRFITEYLEIYKEPRNILLGQGFGSFFHTSYRGFVSLTELTYFEIVRRFGVILGAFQILLMFLPLAFYRYVRLNNKWILLSYGCYLFMVFFNPFYFSSNGMIILSFVLAVIFRQPDNEPEPLME